MNEEWRLRLEALFIGLLVLGGFAQMIASYVTR